jgi:high-affinity iron transporter
VLGTAIIVFREVLEAALIISIVLAASRGVAWRGVWVSGGVATGLLGACIVAVFAQTIAAAATGMGQEVFNASVLFAAILMLGWHNVWMGRHGRELAQQMNTVGRQVQTGEQPLFALAAVVSLAVLREGSEIVLFLYGIAAGGGETVSMLTGAALGLGAGAALGLTLYLGILRIPSRHLFTVTNWMILLLAAGMAAQAAGFLVQAGYLPALQQPLWDTSALLSDRSVVGQILHTLVGYNDRPAGMQLLVYLVTLTIIATLMKVFGGGASPPRRASGTVTLPSHP